MNPQLKPVLTDEEMQQLLKSQVAKPVAPAQPAQPSAPAGGGNLPQVLTDAEINQNRVNTTASPSPTPEVREPNFQENDGILKSMVKDPVKTLLVKPAARFAEVLGRTGVFGKTIKQGYEETADEGQNLDIPLLGKYHIEPVKAFGQGGAKQILGETAKTASYLYGGKGAGEAGKSMLSKAFGPAVVQGIKAGGAGGALYGGGDALEKGGTVGDVAKQSVIGGATGAVVGGAIPAIGGLAKGMIRTVKGASQAAKRANEVAARPSHIAEAIRTEAVDDGTADFISSMSKKDKATASLMTDIAERNASNPRLAQTDSHFLVPGKTINERAGHLIKVKDIGRQQTERVLNSLDNRPQDASDLLLGVLNDMRDQGIVVVKRGNGFQLSSQGAIPEGDLDAYKLVLDILKPEKNGAVPRSYRGLHTARQRLFNEFNLAKTRQKPFSSTAENFVETVRSRMLEKIDKASNGRYKSAQQKTAEALSALREFVQLMGYKGDLEKLATKDLRAAEVANRVLGNAKDRPMTALMLLDDTARKYGFKSESSWLDQVMFADLLENVFGTTQSRSMRGQVGRAGMDIANEITGAATDTIAGNTLGLGQRVVKTLLGKTKEEQIRAFKQFIKTEAGAASPSVFGRKVIK